jgi:squalene cyclase
VATSTLRFAIIVALVVGGIVLIDRAFPAPSTGTSSAGPGGGTSPTPSHSPHPKKSPKPPPSPSIEGTTIAVYNGTSRLGLAGDVQTELVDRFGMVAPHDAANTPSPVAETTLYFRSRGDEVEAQWLADHFFKRLPNVTVTKLGSGTDVPGDVQVAIWVGDDYAALQG